MRNIGSWYLVMLSSPEPKPKTKMTQNTKFCWLLQILLRKMSDWKKEREIQEFYEVDSDESSSQVQHCNAVIQDVIQDIVEAVNSNKAPEMQTKETGKEVLQRSLVPRESVEAPVNKLPRINQGKEGMTSASASQPPKRRRRISTGGISINNEAAGDGGPRRSSRLKERIEAANNATMFDDPYAFTKRPVYMEKKRDEYAYLGEDSEYEEDDSD